jgi:hypothetical protein
MKMLPWPLTETVWYTSVTLPKKLTWPPPTVVSVAWAAVMPKNAVAIAAEEKNLFHSHFLVRVNYESMSTL